MATDHGKITVFHMDIDELAFQVAEILNREQIVCLVMKIIDDAYDPDLEKEIVAAITSKEDNV